MKEIETSIRQAQKLVEAGKIIEAEDIFFQILEKDPDHKEALLWLAQLMIGSGQLFGVKKYVERVMQKYPDDARALLVGANFLMAKERYQEALNILEIVNTMTFNDPIIFYNMAVCKKYLGDVEAAEKLIKKSISKKFRSAKSHYQLADICYLLGDRNKTLRALFTSIAISPNFVPGYAYIGHILEEMGELDALISIYEIGLQWVQDCTFFIAQIARIYALKGEYSKAIETCQKLTEKRQYYGDYLQLGMMYFENQQLAEAEDSFLQALKLKDDSYEAVYNLGLLKENQNQLDDAAGYYERARNLTHDQDPRPLNNLGLLKLKAGDHVGAEALFKRAHTLAPNLEQTTLNLALCRVQAKDLAGAKNYAQRVVRNAPPDSPLEAEAQRLLKNINEMIYLE